MLSAEQIREVVRLPAPQRYEYFVQRVAQNREVWALYRKGWALATKDDGTLVFALWPEREFAQLCAEFEWEGYEPQAFGSTSCSDELLPQLSRTGWCHRRVLHAGRADVMPTPGLLRIDLLDELKR
jgi:hypothetical protein